MPDLTSAQGQLVSSLPDLSRRELLKRYRGRVEGAKKWRESEKYDKT